MKQNKLPRIVVLDIETSPWEALCYGNMYEPVVVKIKSFSQILSMAYRVYGEDTTHYLGQSKLKSYKKGKLNDKDLMIEISKVIKDADYIVGHNLDNFDIKIIRERIFFHRLAPLPEIPSLDTKRLLKTTSKLPSNKLQHLTEFAGNGGKLEHSGTSLFVGCMNGDEKSWKINEKYNKQDVDITYKDLVDMMPYVKMPNTYSKFRADADITCHNPLCLSDDLVKSKPRRTIGGWKQQYQCKDCGMYTQGTKYIERK